MLWIALADDASHAVALHDFAVLTDRLDAAANFHGSSEYKNIQNLSTSRADSDSNEPGGSTQVRRVSRDKTELPVHLCHRRERVFRPGHRPAENQIPRSSGGRGGGGRGPRLVVAVAAG